ncbi:hypothetical protein [Roseburia sp. AF20-18LB]|uniref:hypothetical protein n=1 Tax=Roseburia sp. AF20-18LB TaxID=2293129 RepID=UPI000E498D3E|nr:hypothetical protein [Roseburia sp. AF20-18LB]RGG49924.1 hypothetical protein DWX65_05860 [Roseburia sp. AF20-18LB]
MNGRKKYVGELYSFYRKNRPIGKGGNGAVYEVELLSDNGLGVPMVAKFFEYEGTDKEKRYKRYKNEIIALNELVLCQDLAQNKKRSFANQAAGKQNGCRLYNTG